MKILPSVIALALSFSFHAQADEASHRAAVDKLIVAMNMEKSHTNSLENLVQAQSRQNPALVAMQPTMREFLNKYMGWDAVKDDMAKIYQEGFSEAELGQLVAFYESDLGKKTLQQMPVLIGKGMQIAQERMQKHLPELQAALKEAAEKQGLAPNGPTGAPAPAPTPAK